MNTQTQEMEKLAEALSSLPARIVETDFEAKGYHAEIILDSGTKIGNLAKKLLELEYFVGFVTACHTSPSIQVLYQFAKYDTNQRIMVRCRADENNSIPTISNIFHGADWHERETHDFFGVTFAGHPNLAPFILDESDRDLNPLLKQEKKLKSEAKIFTREEQDG